MSIEPTHSDASRTHVDAALAEAQRRCAGDPIRADLIARTRRFKSSWIELAEALTECRKREYYRKWGHASFEEYYRRELRLKTATVEKLTGSFAFLKHSAPDVLSRDGVASGIPSYETIDFLRRAEEAVLSGNASEDTVKEVRRAVIDDNMSLPKVTRLYKSTLFPDESEPGVRKRRREAQRQARKLSELLAALEGDLPAALIQKVQGALRDLLQALPADEEDDNARAA